MNNGTSIRVLLADDHAMLREGLKALLRDEPGMEVVAEANDGRTAVRLAAELSPDVVIMDIHMPDLNGIEAARQIKGNNGHGPKVIALSAYCDERYTREMLRAGASGYVLKESAFSDLATAVRTVTASETYLSPAVVSHVVPADHGDGPSDVASSAFSKLTSREREVLQLLAEGNATKQAAAALQVSVKTIETHRRNVMEKLGIHSVAELTKYAIRQGLTTVEF